MRTYIIAEAGVNHNGSLEMAKQLVDAAAEAGADAVKFQTFRAHALASATAPKAQYQRETTDSSESQLDMLRALELTEEQHRVLIAHCNARNIEFLSTPFDIPSADLLIHTFDLPRIKIPSGEITNGPLLLHIARTGKPIILSTGMSTLGEVERALGVLAFGYTVQEVLPSLSAFEAAYAEERGQQALKGNVTLLHCTTEYPTPYGEVNLLAMDTMRQAFGLRIGFSDHTAGIAVPIAATARGAVLIEKHFTLSRELSGPDHKASLEPHELCSMVEGIRQVEKALGLPQKGPTSSETKNKVIARKSLIAGGNIQKGDCFSKETLAIKRPGSGISPMEYWAYIGRNATRSYHQDEIIRE